MIRIKIFGSLYNNQYQSSQLQSSHKQKHHHPEQFIYTDAPIGIGQLNYTKSQLQTNKATKSKPTEEKNKKTPWICRESSKSKIDYQFSISTLYILRLASIYLVQLLELLGWIFIFLDSQEDAALVEFCFFGSELGLESALFAISRSSFFNLSLYIFLVT